MRRAAARGVLKGPAAMDLRERRAWVYLDAVAEGTAAEAGAEALRWQHARLLSLYSPALELSARQQLAKAIDDVERASREAIVPWGRPAAPEADVAALEAQWEAAWGGPMDSPEMRARIEEACRRARAPGKRPMPGRTP